MRVLCVILALLVVSCGPPPAKPLPTPVVSSCLSLDGMPDRNCTPGATDPRVTAASIAATICTSGYTATVRPPVSVTENIKRERLRAYGIPQSEIAKYELDHLIPLELGGDPSAIANLWPELWDGQAGAHRKDAVENAANKAVCSGKTPLADAQHLMASDWRTLGHNLGVPGF